MAKIHLFIVIMAISFATAEEKKLGSQLEYMNSVTSWKVTGTDLEATSCSAHGCHVGTRIPDCLEDTTIKVLVDFTVQKGAAHVAIDYYTHRSVLWESSYVGIGRHSVEIRADVLKNIVIGYSRGKNTDRAIYKSFHQQIYAVVDMQPNTSVVIHSMSLKTPYEAAFDAAVNGPAIEELQLYGHGFNIRPAMVVHRDGNSVQICGQISHCLNLRRDDQIYYNIVKNGNEVKIERRIEPGGLTGIAGVVIEIVAAYYGVPIPAELPTKILQRLSNQIHGDWRIAMDSMLGYMAARVK